PGAWTAQRSAGDANHLALETGLGPNVGIWSRATGTFQTLLDQVSFEPAAGTGGVLFLGPDASDDLDVHWWHDGVVSTAVSGVADTWALNAWLVGDDLVGTEGAGFGAPGVVKRASFEPSACPLAGEAVAPIAHVGSGRASERFYVSA